jgi:hypothetical protein
MWLQFMDLVVAGRKFTNCETCGKPFLAWGGKKRAKKFCSGKCRVKGKRQSDRGKKGGAR